MIEKIEGIVVGERAYGETSKILDVFTKEYGVIGVMAKGCRKLKSDLRSVSNKLTYGNFHLYYKKDKLSTLISIDVTNLFKNIKTDISKISYASFLLELSHGVYKQNPDPSIYTLLIDALQKIEEGFDEALITAIVELKYLYYLGIMPVLDGCAICGEKTCIVTLSSTKGGYICKNCYSGEDMVSTKTIKLIRMFFYLDIAKIEKLEIGNREKSEITYFLDAYYDSYAGLYLKSKNFLRNLNKI
ncbi:MAG: DNA repair protein RecO [Bacilli bacterium]|nr:DNA repair protein RecO [Bacilli bacterium]